MIKHYYSFLMAIVFAIILAIFLTESEPHYTNQSIKVTAYYQTNTKRRLAMAVAIWLFRRAYPSSGKLYVHVDNVDSHTTVTGADKVTHNAKTTDSSAIASGMFFDSVSAVLHYIERLKLAAAMQSDGWVLTLEDDVWIISPVTDEDLHFDMCGVCWAYFDEAFSTIIRETSLGPVFKNATCYGGCGGHYIKSSRILGLNMKQIANMTERLFSGGRKIVASDEILSASILQNGGSIGEYSGYTELERSSKALDKNGQWWLKTVHQMKLLYKFS